MSAIAISLSLVFAMISSISGLLEIIFNHVGRIEDSNTRSGLYLGLESYELRLIIWLSASLMISTAVYMYLVVFITKNQQTRLTSFAIKVKNLIYVSS